MNKLTLGIDFGTTKTLVSYVNPKTGRPETIRLGRGSDYLPTSVYVDEDGSFFFGDHADDEMEHAAQRYSRGFKMKLGSPVSALGFFDGTRFHKYSARELTRAFLSYIKTECEEHTFMGQSVHRAVITCPVSFSPAQRAELEDTARQAGFREVQLVTEPEAAGLAFCTLCPETCFKGNALIVDWGGGTLDMALVSRKGERVTTYNEHTIGDMEMGGEVFDARLWLHVASRLRAEHGVDLNMEKPEQQGALLKRIRQEKEMLTKHEQRRVRLSSSQGPCPPLEITRGEFERLIVADVEKATQLVHHLLSSIREDSLKPEMLLLVGGTSLVPCIASALEKSIGLPCHKWQYSREAVSLGAALAGYESAPAGQNEAAEPKTSSEPMRHTLHLTREEMEQGCIKAFTIQDKSLEVRIPAGVKAGGKLRLSSDKTQGLGELILKIVPIAAEPQDAGDSYFQQAIDYFDGRNGKPQDYAKSTEAARLGHQKGDLNCTYLLCQAYESGYGVPRDYRMMVQLAEEMEAKGFVAAYSILGNVYAKGLTVPLNAARAAEYYSRVREQLSVPVPGVQEDVRIAALYGAHVAGNKPDLELFVHHAREFYRTSSRRHRFVLLAIPLLSLALDESTAMGAEGEELMKLLEKNPKFAEALTLLDEGCKQGDPVACWFKGKLLMEGILLEQDIFLGRKLLRQAAEGEAEPECLSFVARHAADESEFNYYIERFWKACRYGTSLLPRKDELPCSIRVTPAPLTHAYEVTTDGLRENALKENRIVPLPPRILLENDGKAPIRNIKVRLCCEDKAWDKTIELTEPIKPGESVYVDPEDYNLNMGDNVYVQVSSEGRYADMTLGCDWSDFKREPDDFPPLSLRWGWGLFGGKILKVQCTDGRVHNLTVTKLSSKISAAPFDLNQGTTESVGWAEFSDYASIKDGEAFVITCDEYPSFLGVIR